MRKTAAILAAKHVQRAVECVSDVVERRVHLQQKAQRLRAVRAGQALVGGQVARIEPCLNACMRMYRHGMDVHGITVRTDTCCEMMIGLHA